MTKYNLLSLSLVIIALGVTEAMRFPGLKLINDCIEMECGGPMRSCLKMSHMEFTSNAKGCIIRDCKNAFKLCMKQIPNNVFSYGKVMAEKFQQYADLGLDVFSDSYLQCWINTDIHNGTQLSDCVVDELLNQIEPFVTLFGSALFSDPAFMTCGIVHSFKSLLSLFLRIHMETDYMEQLEENKEIEAQRNLYEYIRCFEMNNFNADCNHVWNRIMGTPPMRQQTKDFFVAGVHDLISVTAKCRRF
ncbi:uncharacterized protein LOC134086903 [Sardina pilchardus]|uniref:uncharacterized protein LOC134086903 n=1 Tax=Sardina pilchardus TaxID=27697 RepID=UPI002E12C060